MATDFNFLHRQSVPFDFSAILQGAHAKAQGILAGAQAISEGAGEAGKFAMEKRRLEVEKLFREGMQEHYKQMEALQAANAGIREHAADTAAEARKYAADQSRAGRIGAAEVTGQSRRDVANTQSDLRKSLAEMHAQNDLRGRAAMMQAQTNAEKLHEAIKQHAADRDQLKDHIADAQRNGWISDEDAMGYNMLVDAGRGQEAGKAFLAQTSKAADQAHADRMRGGYSKMLDQLGQAAMKNGDMSAFNRYSALASSMESLPGSAKELEQAFKELLVQGAGMKVPQKGQPLPLEAAMQKTLNNDPEAKAIAAERSTLSGMTDPKKAAKAKADLDAREQALHERYQNIFGIGQDVPPDMRNPTEIMPPQPGNPLPPGPLPSGQAPEGSLTPAQGFLQRIQGGFYKSEDELQSALKAAGLTEDDIHAAAGGK